MPDKDWDQPQPRQLRVEAGPAQWVELDSAQRTAYLRIGTMVSEAVSDMGSASRGEEAGDRLRRTQTAFVMGGRGTGKTTVLSTLRRDSGQGTEGLGQGRRSQAARDQAHVMPTEDRDKVLSKIAGRLVWLETLDMEPLPPDANLLAAILVRLEDAARAYGVKEAPQLGRARGLLEPSSDYHAALLELQRLQTDVALAWDGNLRDRKGHLDPDTYAVEMMRIEQARLSLNRRFADTFETLAEHVFRSARVHDPLFVLPVDDFDLNPPTCLDLLRVLRLISIPRLFTIILGDLQVAQTVLSLKLSHDIGTIADSRIHRDMLAIDPGSVGVLAGDVAANAIRKLLPPAHRVELRPMSVLEALNFRPLGAPSSDPALHELFAECGVFPQWTLPPVPGVAATPLEKQPGKRASLRQLLLAPPMIAVISDATPKRPHPTFDEQAVSTAVYSARSVIQAPPRRVADMWLGIHQLGEPDEDDRHTSERLLKHFAEVCRDALRETPLFTPDENGTSIEPSARPSAAPGRCGPCRSRSARKRRLAHRSKCRLVNSTSVVSAGSRGARRRRSRQPRPHLLSPVCWFSKALTGESRCLAACRGTAAPARSFRAGRRHRAWVGIHGRNSWSNSCQRTRSRRAPCLRSSCITTSWCSRVVTAHS